MRLPWRPAVSSAIFHCSASALGPPGSPAPIESTPRPYLPAATMPKGVVGPGRHARAQHDGAGALGGWGDEDLGRSDSLPSRRVVLADPHLVVAEMVEPLDELHVARQGEGGVLADPVERGEEDAELHARVSHGVSVGTVVRRIVARAGGRG